MGMCLYLWPYVWKTLAVAGPIFLVLGYLFAKERLERYVAAKQSAERSAPSEA